MNVSNLLTVVLALTSCRAEADVSAGFTHYDLASYGVVNSTLPLNDEQSHETVYAFNLKGISVRLKGPLFNLSSKTDYLFLENSRLDLYDDRGALVDAESCSADLFESRDLRLFGNMLATTLVLSLSSNSFRNKLCPYIFKNAAFRQFIMSGGEKNALFHNEIAFHTICNPTNRTIHLHAYFDTLVFEDVYRLRFVRQPENIMFFFHTPRVSISGLVASFETGFFADFQQLTFLNMALHNVAELFHSSPNAWLAAIFVQAPTFERRQALAAHLLSVQGDIEAYSLIWSVSQGPHNVYIYPDEDFCLFKHFPRLRPFLANLTMQHADAAFYTYSDKVSCTYRFLSQNNNLFLAAGLVDVVVAAFNDSQLDECDFDRRLDLCTGSEAVKMSGVATYVDYLDVVYVLGWLEYIGPIITFPLFSALAFALNLLVLLIIRNKKNRQEMLFESKMFRYIEMNSAFNCAECLLYQLRLLGLCLGANSLFCSSVRESTFVFYLGVVRHVFGEAMKSCSVMTGLLFSLQRFIETSKTKNGCLARFSLLSCRRVLVFVLLYGLVVSLPCVFSIDLVDFDNYYDTPSTFYVSVQIYALGDSSRKAKSYFYFAHYALNDLVVLALNLAVDGCLVRVIKQDLEQKMHSRWQRTRAECSSSSQALCELERKKLKEEERKKTAVERKANAMIVISLVVYFFCRLPELAGVFVLFYYYSFARHICESSLACYLVANSIEYLYMFSYIFNIVLYYKFSTFFERGFRQFFGLKPRL